MRRAMQSVGMKMFVDFFDAFKTGQKDETIRLLQQHGDALSGARTRWSVAQRIFENGWQRDILELIISSGRMDEETKTKARTLLTRERR